MSEKPNLKSESNSLKVKVTPAASLNASNAGEMLKSEIAPSRKKVILGRGYSLMDWIRVTKTTPDLAGNNGILQRITHEELAKHNKEDDCWLALFDKVYNVTPYMKFHPGGVDELMRGAGMNATKLFNDVHPWVNLQNMLEKCLVGVLVGGSSSPEPSTKLSTRSQETHVEKDRDSEPQAPSKIPELDFYQTNETANVILYSKWKFMKPEYIIIDKRESETGTNIDIFAYILNNVYKYTIDMLAAIKSNIDVRVSREGGKVEITFYKMEKIYWSKMNPKLKYTCDPVLYTQSGVNFRECELVNKKQVTHDTDIYTFELPKSTKMSVPLGYHVFLRFLNEKYLVKPYTVVDESCEVEKTQVNPRHLHLMIKHYANGEFTSKLRNLTIGSKIEISNFAGSFQRERLSSCEELILVCAGTGFTPMIRLINCALQISSINQIKFLFFNKTTRDILWKEKLDDLKFKYANKLSVFNVLSEAESEWNGSRGRINKELLNEFVFNSPLKQPLFCICGPKAFSDLAQNLLNGLNIKNESIHIFSS